MIDDGPLWHEYWSACSDDEAKHVAGRIVEHHFGFLVDYARRTAQRSWNAETREDYLHELVLVALARVPEYRHDRNAKFVTFLSPYLRPVRWKLVGNTSHVRVGYETARLTAEVDRLLGDGVTDIEAIAAHLSDLHGKRIGVERVRRIVSRPRAMYGDETISNPYNGERMDEKWDLVSDNCPSVEDQAIENLEGVSIDAEVSSALMALGLSPLEFDLVVERLMRPPAPRWGEDGRTSYLALASRHEVRSGVVREVETELVKRLRGRLAHLVDGADVPGTSEQLRFPF